MDFLICLKRINYLGGRSTPQDTLRALHLSHVLTVSFENLDGYRGVPVSLEPADLFAKIGTGRVSSESFGGRG